MYVPDFDEGYHGDGAYIVSSGTGVDFVSLYTEFTDGTSMDIVIKHAERGHGTYPLLPVFSEWP